MPALFDILTLDTEKATAVAVTATTSGAPQTVVTMTTPSRPAGKYVIGYSFQVTFQAKDRPLSFKIGGDFADAAYFEAASGTNDSLHMNHIYSYPIDHTGGAVTISMEMFDPLAEAVIDFVDVGFKRIG